MENRIFVFLLFVVVFGFIAFIGCETDDDYQTTEGVSVYGANYEEKLPIDDPFPEYEPLIEEEPVMITGFDNSTLELEVAGFAGNVIGFMKIETDVNVVTVRQTDFEPAVPSDSESSIDDVDIGDPSASDKKCNTNAIKWDRVVTKESWSYERILDQVVKELLPKLARDNCKAIVKWENTDNGAVVRSITPLIRNL